MSLGIYPVFEPKLTQISFDALGETLAANAEALDQVARAAQLTPITAFMDNRPAPEDFDGDPEEALEIMGEWTEWFDPAQGQSVMLALSAYIKASPKAASHLSRPAEVVAELEEMARVLGAAVSQGSRFRLQMS